MFKYPNRIPVIIETFHKDTQRIPHNKLLIPKEMTMGQLVYLIRQKIYLDPKDSIYIFVDKNVLPPVSKNISELYAEYRDTDGFLYLSYTRENTFG